MLEEVKDGCFDDGSGSTTVGSVGKEEQPADVNADKKKGGQNWFRPSERITFKGSRGDKKKKREQKE